MDEIILDLATWHAAENPNEHEVVDDGFDMAAEIAAADADADDEVAGAPGGAAPHPAPHSSPHLAPPSGDGTLPPGAPLPDDFEEI